MAKKGGHLGTGTIEVEALLIVSDRWFFITKIYFNWWEKGRVLFFTIGHESKTKIGVVRLGEVSVSDFEKRGRK